MNRLQGYYYCSMPHVRRAQFLSPMVELLCVLSVEALGGGGFSGTR